MKKISSFISRTWAGTLKHKIRSIIILGVVIIAGYYGYKHFFPASTVPQYTVTTAHTGNIMQTVTGTGQVSAENQTDVKSQVSGTILTIPVKVGQHVSKGDVLATIDSSDAQVSLQNAQIAYAKLTQPAKQSDIDNANNNVTSAYTSGYNNVSSAFIDLPAVMSGLKDLLYSQSGFLSDQQSSYLISTARTYRDTAGASYDIAVNEYANVLSEYRSADRTSSTSTIEKLLADTNKLLKDVSAALQNAQNTITYVTTYQPEYQSKTASTASANVNTWSSQINGDLSSIVSSQNSITSSKTTLANLIQGADSLDIQSQLLSLQQAQKNFSEYTIRAPFDGIVGKIPVNVYDEAGGSTVMATIIGDQKVANISLNEVDAAKVSAGQPVTITFDAIDGLNATGTVVSVDQIGTVSSGVVSYGVKIAINTSDPRIKPGMSVNTTIVTFEKDNVLIVPSTAIKTQGKASYVQTLDRSVIMQTNGITANNNGSASSFGTSSGNRYASSTRTFASSTRAFSGSYSANSFGSSARNISISTTVSPTDVTVTTGASDDTNTEIIDGLQAGEFVITKTSSVSATTAQSSSAPSILSSFGGRAGGTRVTTGGARPGN